MNLHGKTLFITGACAAGNYAIGFGADFGARAPAAVVVWMKRRRLP